MSHGSIRTLLAAILVFPIGLAALRNANELSAEVMLLAVMIFLSKAVFATIFLRGRVRARWTGLALFSGGYLVFTLVPLLRDHLPTGVILEDLRQVMFASDDQALPDSQMETLWVEKQTLETSLARLPQSVRDSNADPAVVVMANFLEMVHEQLAANENAGPRYEYFQRVGQSCITPLAGFLGGTIDVQLYARRERHEDSP